MIQREFAVDFQMRYMKATGDYDDGTFTGPVTDGKVDGMVLSGTYYFN